ncbi:hypothetical protein [Nonomuraea dietziae]|uniref:hypothetical protein n=1 Tax=Nonomuraea dietziae TaxID=65515 RepID=UPI0031D01A14
MSAGGMEVDRVTAAAPMLLASCWMAERESLSCRRSSFGVDAAEGDLVSAVKKH